MNMMVFAQEFSYVGAKHIKQMKLVKLSTYFKVKLKKWENNILRETLIYQCALQMFPSEGKRGIFLARMC